MQEVASPSNGVPIFPIGSIWNADLIHMETSSLRFLDPNTGKVFVQCSHDEAIIAEAQRFAKEKGIAADRFEFQMLYGVRRDLQERLARDGYRMRVYVPFGTQWYPYLMRRLAERPANLAFMAGNVVKEMLGGSAQRAANGTVNDARNGSH